MIFIVVNIGKGNGFSGEILTVEGQEIVSIASTVVKIENVVFTYDRSSGDVTGLSSQPHDLVIGDDITVSGLSTDTLRTLDGRHQIGFNTSFLKLGTGIGTTGLQLELSQVYQYLVIYLQTQLYQMMFLVLIQKDF